MAGAITGANWGVYGTGEVEEGGRRCQSYASGGLFSRHDVNCDKRGAFTGMFDQGNWVDLNIERTITQIMIVRIPILHFLLGRGRWAGQSKRRGTMGQLFVTSRRIIYSGIQ
eukprot:286045-Amorphochlora_amoeboformis.AAC.2